MMRKNNINKRRFERVFFSKKQVVEGRIILSDANKNITVRVLNISEGGLHFTWKNQSSCTLEINDQVTLKSLTSLESFCLPPNITLEIKWVLDHEVLEFTGYGCEFKGLTDQQVAMIRASFIAFQVNNK